MSYLEEEWPKHYLVSTESGWCWDRNGVVKGTCSHNPSLLVSTGTVCSNLQHWLCPFFFPFSSPNLYFRGKPEFSWSWQNSLSPVTKPLSRWAQVLAKHSGSCWALRSVISSRSIWAFPSPLAEGSECLLWCSGWHPAQISHCCLSAGVPQGPRTCVVRKGSRNVPASQLPVWCRYRRSAEAPCISLLTWEEAKNRCDWNHQTLFCFPEVGQASFLLWSNHLA